MPTRRSGKLFSCIALVCAPPQCWNARVLACSFWFLSFASTLSMVLQPAIQSESRFAYLHHQQPHFLQKNEPILRCPASGCCFCSLPALPLHWLCFSPLLLPVTCWRSAAARSAAACPAWWQPVDWLLGWSPPGALQLGAGASPRRAFFCCCASPAACCGSVGDESPGPAPLLSSCPAAEVAAALLPPSLACRFLPAANKLAMRLGGLKRRCRRCQCWHGGWGGSGGVSRSSSSMPAGQAHGLSGLESPLHVGNALIPGCEALHRPPGKAARRACGSCRGIT